MASAGVCTPSLTAAGVLDVVPAGVLATMVSLLRAVLGQGSASGALSAERSRSAAADAAVVLDAACWGDLFLVVGWPGVVRSSALASA